MEYRSYLRSVSGRLAADDYLVEASVDIPGYKVDLYAFKELAELRAGVSADKQIACLLIQIAVCSRRVVEDFCKSAVSYEAERRGKIINTLSHRGTQPVRLIIPVVVSRFIGKDSVDFVKSYNPFSWQVYQHPVIVNLETGEVNHRAGLKLYGAAYERMLNRIVDEDIAPK